jgi:hypothetical protein
MDFICTTLFYISFFFVSRILMAAGLQRIVKEYVIKMVSVISQQNNREHGDFKNIVNNESIVQIQNNQQTGTQFEVFQVSTEKMLN